MHQAQQRTSMVVALCASLLLALTFVAPCEATSASSHIIGTVNIDKSVPFPTGHHLPTSYERQHNPLFSMMAGTQQDVYIFQHFEDVPKIDFGAATIVLQAFNATSGKPLYKKRMAGCMSNYINSDTYRNTYVPQVFSVNATHAMFFCRKNATVPGKIPMATPRLFVFNAETGEDSHSVEATYLNGEKVILNYAWRHILKLNVASPEDGLFAISDSINEYIFSLPNNTFTCFNMSLFGVVPQAMAVDSKMLISSTFGDTQVVAQRLPLKDVVWMRTFSVIGIIGSDTFKASSGTTVVPILASHDNGDYSSSLFQLHLIDAETGETNGRIVNLTDSKRFFFFHNAGPTISSAFQFHGPVPTGKGRILVLEVKNIQYSNKYYTYLQTSGVIAINVDRLVVAWTYGFVPSHGLMYSYNSNWHNDPSLATRFGWLVRANPDNHVDPLISLHDLASGRVLASASSTSSRGELIDVDEGTPHLQLPTAHRYETPHNVLAGAHKQIASTLFEDVLLLKYPHDSAPTKTLLTGIRLVGNTTFIAAIQFDGSFEIDVSQADSFNNDLHYSVKTRLTQRFANNTMIVPMFNRDQGKSQLLWVNITHYQHHAEGTLGRGASSPHSPKTAVLFIAIGCVVGVAAVAVAILVFKNRPQSHDQADGHYAHISDDDEYKYAATNQKKNNAIQAV